MRDFDQFLDFCRNSISYKNMAYTDAFYRIIHYWDNNHYGHFKQLFYAIYDFYILYPDYRTLVGAPPFEISDNESFMRDWVDFLNNPNNNTNEYNASSLISKLPQSCGGNLTNGGGWSPTAKILFSTVALYLS